MSEYFDLWEQNAYFGWFIRECVKGIIAAGAGDSDGDTATGSAEPDAEGKA